MNESKSKIISFRLTAELEALASSAAAADGDKNASAWCQRLVKEALLKMAEPEQKEAEPEQKGNEEQPLQALHPLFVNDLLKALGNIRQLNLDCFKMSLKNGEQYKEFLNVAIASEEEWEAIRQSGNPPAIENPGSENESNLTAENSSPPASFGGPENLPASRTGWEKIPDDYRLFAQEIELEVAELNAGAQELTIFQNDRSNRAGSR